MAEQEQQQKDSTLKPVYRRGWFKWLLALVILFAAFITVLPIGVRYAAIHLLQQQGIQQVQIDDIDLNLFSGEASLTGVRVSGDGQRRASLGKLYINVALLDLINRRIRLQYLEVDQLELDLQNSESGDWVAAGILPPTPEPSAESDTGQADEPWDFGIDQLKLAGINVHLVMPKLQSDILIDALQLSSLASWQPQQDSNIQLRMNIDQASLDFSGQVRAFNTVPRANGTLKLERFPLSMVSKFAEDAGFEQLQGQLDVSTDFHVSLEGEIPLLETKTNLNLSDLKVKQGQYALQTTQLTVITDSKTKLVVEQPQLESKTEVSITALELQQEQNNLRVNQLIVNTDLKAMLVPEQPQLESMTKVSLLDLEIKQDQYELLSSQFNWNGQVDYTTPTSDQDLGLRLNGAVALNQFSLVDEQNHMSLVLLEQMDLKDVVLSEQQAASIATINLNQLDLVENKEQERLVRLASVNASDVDFDGQQSLAINDITLNGLMAKILVRPDGQIHLLDELLQSSSSQTQDESATTEPEAVVETSETPDWQFKLARLHISDDSRIVFEDRKSTPPQLADITPFSLTVADIDTTAINQDILVDVMATINKHEQLALNAKIKPFTEKLNMSADAKIKSLDLPPFSHYLDQQIGYGIEEGRLNSTVSMTVVDDFLDAKVNIKLNKFHINQSDAAKAEGFSSNLTMPLDTALGMLRDKHDNIELDIPVSGDINDPNFNINQVINKALVKATSVAVTGYLAFALQPWGAALAVAHIASSAVGSVSLDPVMFDPGQIVLKEEYRDYFAKIAALLEERPEVGLNVCGIVSEQDRLALFAAQQQEGADQQTEKGIDAEQAKQTVDNKQLIDLATQRTDLVKEALIESGADAGRLFECHPEVKGADKNSPAVLLYI